ncbi:hypothetical protein BSKO_03984 [Bryopsis sp. KO-2023]|nr:hypothetical protein BSKO_03984 [Bryopsis sp. KO-2023]
MKTWSVVLLLAFAVHGATANVSSRVLLARAKSPKKAVAEDGGPSSAFANSVAKGNVNAIAEAISEANRGGKSSSVAKALAEEYKKGDSKAKDAIATAIASATDLSKEEANKALQNGDAQNIAEAIASSTGGQAIAVAKSASEAASEERNTIVNAVSEAYSKASGRGEALAEAQVAANAIGKATARAMASAEVYLRLVDTSVSDSFEPADVQTIAKASAQAIAEGIAKAENDLGKLAVVKVKVDVVSTAIVEASANAFATAKQLGPGEVSAVQVYVSEAVAEPVAKVLFEAIALALGKEVDSFVYVGRVGETTGSAEDFQDGGCVGIVKALCCNRKRDDSKQDKCGCRPNGQKCRAESKRKNSEGFVIEWKVLKNGEFCSCCY